MRFFFLCLFLCRLSCAEVTHIEESLDFLAKQIEEMRAAERFRISFPYASEELSAEVRESLELLAEEIELDDIRWVPFVERPHIFAAISKERWVRGGALIIAGSILIHYDSPLHEWGMRLIQMGIEIIGQEYWQKLKDFLIEKDLLQPQDIAKLTFSTY